MGTFSWLLTALILFVIIFFLIIAGGEGRE
jgi:hypothetical protein